ncbi:hypothetical protein [Rossellomorea sp. DA94]|nr:hypothetical protein [Rossellomorea sp. DA94]WGG47693.1 hypothetical protein P8596_10985 [Rossellomorea sp. DA94]
MLNDHDLYCDCKKCSAEAEDGIDSMYPNLDLEDKEEFFERELSKALDR